MLSGPGFWRTPRFGRPLLIPREPVPSERVFSSAGLIVTDSPSLLNTEHIEELIFCQQNYRRLPGPRLKLDEKAFLEENKNQK